MATVQISDELKDVIDRHLANGVAVSEADFVEEAVRRFADALDDDADALIVAANEGIESIRLGQYTTISSPEDQAAYWQKVWSQATILAEDMRAAHKGGSDEDQESTRTGG